MALAGKNILVTGGCGFIGSHLVEKLLILGANVIVTNQDINPNSYFFKNSLNRKSVLVQVDVKDFKRTLDVISKYEIVYVFHLAAQSIVSTAYINPVETFESNIMGTVSILESCRLYGKVKGIVVSSSDKAYGKIPRARETDPLVGNHPYESSKSAADLIAQTYFVTYKLPVVVTRFGNTYGEGDLNFSRLIPGIMEAVVKNKMLKIRSDGKYVRDYVYVGDITSALITILKSINKTKGEAFNVSSLENLSVVDLVKKVGEILNVRIRYKILNEAVNEIPTQSINFIKIVKHLGWKPQNNLTSTIPVIFKWYQNYFEDTRQPPEL